MYRMHANGCKQRKSHACLYQPDEESKHNPTQCTLPCTTEGHSFQSLCRSLHFSWECCRTLACLAAS